MEAKTLMTCLILPTTWKFPGKIFKIYSLNIWGMSYTDKGCLVSISETDAEKFWIKSSGLSQFSSNSNCFLSPTDTQASSSQTYHDPSKKSETTHLVGTRNDSSAIDISYHCQHVGWWLKISQVKCKWTYTSCSYAGDNVREKRILMFY